MRFNILADATHTLRLQIRLCGWIKLQIISICFLTCLMAFCAIFAPKAIAISFNNNIKDKKINFLVISDIHLNTNKSSQRRMTINPYMYNPYNDLDKKTFIELLASINENIKGGIVPKPEFVIVLGDIAAHRSWRSWRKSSQKIYDDETEVFRQLKKYFSPTPIFYIFGNSDSFERNYGLFTYNSKSGNKKYSSPYQVAKMAEWKDGFLSTGTICKNKNITFPCLISEDRNIGYYAAYLKPHLKLIALNSVLFDKKNSYKILEQSAQKKQRQNQINQEWQWLKAQLQNTQNNHDAVLIAMHIPVGNNIFDHAPFWQEPCKQTFLSYIHNYKDNIIGILVGHTHDDELKIIKTSSLIPAAKNSENSSALDAASPNVDSNEALMLFTAALSTTHGNAPSVKTFCLTNPPLLDDQNVPWMLYDYTTFNFILDDESSTNSKIFLKKLYDYRELYCETNQSSSDMLKCLDSSLITGIIAKIHRYYTAGNPNFSGIILSPSDVVVQ